MSKLLSKILRHDPSIAGITLDPNGWAVIVDLIDGINKNSGMARRKGMVEVTKCMLDEIVAADSKGR
jgi:RNA:NAD 2'-phosphotransferase (TPT1/KptA family)